MKLSTNTSKGIVAVLLLSFAMIVACKEEDDDDNNGISLDSSAYNLEIGDFPPPQISPDNPLTIQGVKLGRMLFYENKLSKDGSQNCASCHRQQHAFTDTAKFSTGVEGLLGGRQAMAVFNMAWNGNEFFWDGRAHLLRDQSLKPIQDPLEMNETLENVIAKLNADKTYQDQFTRAFGSSTVTEERISLALEQFMNSIVSVDSKYDKFLRGEATLTTNEERGRFLFFSEYNPSFPNISGADCAHCHAGKNFENDRYMNNGLDSDQNRQDSGRAAVTGSAGDLAKFKVTSLRNVEITPPFMHDGRFTTLDEVVDHYNTGMNSSSTIDPALLYPLNNGGLQLTAQDKADLISFLKTLTDDVLITNLEYSDPF